MNAEADSILNEEIHARLLDQIEQVATTARVPRYMIHESASKYLTGPELEWLKNIRKARLHGQVGLALVGQQGTVAVETKMMAMAAALVRNFIDARVIPLAELLPESTSTMEHPTVLFIPNFYVVSHGKPLASWQLQQLHSLMLKRFVEQRVTVLYIQSMDKLEAHYGEGITTHIKQNYQILEG